MESVSSTPTSERPDSAGSEKKTFKIDSSSLLRNRTPEKKSNRISSSPDWTYKGLANTAWDRVGFIRGALGDKTSEASNGPKSYSTEALYKPLSTRLNIDRTQSLMTPAGYPAYSPAYRPTRELRGASQAQSLNPQASISSSSLSTAAGNSQDGEENTAEDGKTSVALTRSFISESSLTEKREEETSYSYSRPRESPSSLSRGSSATPTGSLNEEKKTHKSSRNFQRTAKITRQSSTSPSSSDEEELEESSTREKSSKSGYSSTDSSRTPTASPLPKNYHTPLRAELIQRNPDQASAITGLKTALDLAQKKSMEDKKVIEDLKTQLQICKEEQAKEDPVLKAALEDALRQIRENKDVITNLKLELNKTKRTNDTLQKELSTLKAKLEENENGLSENLSKYQSQVLSLEQENMELKKEKEEVTDKLAEISTQLETQESIRMKEKQQLETSMREMEDQISNTQRDKLYAAIKTEDIEAIENLIQTQIDLDAVIAQDNTGRRAIHLLADNVKMTSIISQLVDAKVDINATDSDGETALHIAARSGRGRIVKILLEAKADWTIQNSLGWTAVQVAAAIGNVSALEEFRKIDPGALKFKDGEGSTLLHYTSANNQKKASQWLMRHGSSKRRKDAYGLLARDYKDAAKGDESLLACFGGGGNRLAHEQLPRLQLQAQDSFRRSQDFQVSGSLRGSGSIRRSHQELSRKQKSFSETDQSSQVSISEKQSETEAEVGDEIEASRQNSFSLTESDTSKPQQPKFIKNHSARKSKRKNKLSVGSDSGLSEDTASVTLHQAPRTPPRSEMRSVSLRGRGSLSEDQSSDISMISSKSSFKERLPTGLPNLGSTCFMNAILQCLYYTKPLSDNFIQRRFKDNINRRSAQSGEVALTFADIVTSLRTGKQTFAAVKKMKEVVGHYEKSFAEEDVRDAHDFLVPMLQWLHQDLSKGQVSLVSTVFFGVHLSTIFCQESGTEISKKEEVFTTISVPVEISGATDLQELLTNTYKPKLVLWSCSECGKDHMCLKKQRILRPPNHLIIHFNRDDEVRGNLMNSKMKLTYPQEDLSLADYLVDPSNGGRNTYELYAICNRKDHGATSHHTACCMTAKPPVWCLFNDLTVNPTTLEEVTEQPDSHILFYKISSTLNTSHSTDI